MYGAGINSKYELGLGEKGPHKVISSTHENKPVKITTVSGLGITKVIAGGFSAALTTQN